jgi:hypothetical protein
MATRSRKRRAPLSFDWTPVADSADEPPPLPDVRLRHTHVNLDAAGPSRSRTSYISAPASPSKRAGSSFDDGHDNYNWNPDPAPPEITVENYPFLDPAYQHHLDLKEPGPPRRKRTAEVREFFSSSSVRMCTLTI